MPGIESLEAAWLAWIETEKRKRLGLSIYVGSRFVLFDFALFYGLLLRNWRSVSFKPFKLPQNRLSKLDQLTGPLCPILISSIDV